MHVTGQLRLQRIVYVKWPARELGCSSAPEGAGKSVQAKRLAAALTARGLSVTLTREPGGTPGAEEIRALLVQGAHGRWTALTELMLFAAARSDHLDRLIRPKLAEGSWVISDRFADSTLAYQSAGGGLDRDVVEGRPGTSRVNLGYGIELDHGIAVYPTITGILVRTTGASGFRPR